MEQRLTIITLGVKNVRLATHFYETTFGWKKSKFSNEHITFFILNGIQLALYKGDDLAKDAEVPAKGSGFKSFTLSHNARSVEAVDKLFDRLEKNGATIVKPPRHVDWGGYSGYITDLDENLWEIAFNPYLELDKDGNTSAT